MSAKRARLRRVVGPQIDLMFRFIQGHVQDLADIFAGYKRC